jgi:hypothetical protein
MTQRLSWPTAVVALGFLALVGVMFWRATSNPATFTFTDVWSAAGPIVGVVVGAVPAAVFGTRSQETARKASVRAETYAARLTPEKAAEAESAAKDQLG